MQLITELKALPADERARVIRAVMPAAKPAARPVGKGRTPKGKVTWPDLADLKRRVYGDRVLPNLVLLEREEARY